MAQVAQSPLSKTDTHQKFDKAKIGDGQDINNFLSQQEALRRATLLKHRKVSTQLKLDMVQRQLNNLRRTVPESENDRQFYRQQMSELSNELQDLGSTLEKMERNAYYARRRMLRHYGTDFGSTGALHLSSSHPAIYSSSETLSQSSGRNSLKKKVYHMMSSPTEKLRKRHLFGELRAVASLSSLNIKSTSHASCEDVNISKDAKPWKGPFKFLGNLMDSRIRRKLWGSTKRIKSEDNILEEKKASSSLDISKDCNGFNTSGTEDNLSSSSSSESSDEEEVEESEKWVSTVPAKHVWKAPVVRKVASSQRAQIDPAILAEIEKTGWTESVAI